MRHLVLGGPRPRLGPICEQEIVLVFGTPRELYEAELIPAGLRSLARALRALRAGYTRRVVQDERVATYESWVPGDRCQKKWNAQTCGKLLKAIRAGNFVRVASVYAGIPHDTYYRWLKKGGAVKSGAYGKFYERVQAAEATAETALIADWKSAAPQDWRAARDFLARRGPCLWSPKRPVETPEAPEEVLKIDLENSLRKRSS